MQQRSAGGPLDLRGAVILGGLVLLCLVIAFGGGFFALHQLDAAEWTQAQLTEAQSELDHALRVQLDEQIELRSYAATREHNLLQGYGGQSDAFDEPVDELRTAMRGANVRDAQSVGLVDDMVRAHRRWHDEVAAPILASPTDRDANAREITGKLLIDQLRGDANALRHRLIGERDALQGRLRREIYVTVELSAFLVAAAAIAALLFGVGRNVAVARLERQHTIVSTLQRSLRAQHAPLRGTRIGTCYVSATIDAEIGGDLFDMWEAPGGRAYMLSADFSGKGIDAAVNIAFVQHAIRTLAMERSDPGEILSAFNRVFAHTIADPALFVVVFLGRLDRAPERLTYASAGHGAAYLRRGTSVETLPPTGAIVGIAESGVYETRIVDLVPGDTIVLATDGLTEARNLDGDLLGDERVEALIAHGPEDPQELCDRLVDEVVERAGGVIKDDLALLAVRIVGEESAVAGRPPRGGNEA